MRSIPRDGVNVTVAVRLGVFSKSTLPGFAAVTTDNSRAPSIAPSDLHTRRTCLLSAVQDFRDMLLFLLALLACHYTNIGLLYFQYVAAMDIIHGVPLVSK